MDEPRSEGAPGAPTRRRRGDGGRRERLLETATREFAAKGLAGARVDAIARAARSNKQLVYYYFGNKIGLYNEVVGRIGPGVHEELYPDTGDPALTLVSASGAGRGTRGARSRRAGAGCWAGRRSSAATRTSCASRSAAARWRHRSREIEDAQARGEVDARFDPELLGLALLAVELMPRVLPQVTKMVTGLSFRDPEFARRQEELLVELVEHLRAPDGGDGDQADASTSR